MQHLFGNLLSLSFFLENPYYCRNANIQTLQLNLGSRTIPSTSFDNNVGTNRSLLSFWQTVTGLGYHWGADSFAGYFNRVSFQNAMFINCFDLTRFVL